MATFSSGEFRPELMGGVYQSERLSGGIPPFELRMLHALHRMMRMDFAERDSEIYRATRSLGEYVLEQEVADVVLLDRSARPVWVGLYEYLDLAHPEEQKPDIHFINPDALMTKGFNVPLARSYKSRRARRQLAGTKSSLAEPSEDPLLVFDPCLHTGTTMTAANGLMQDIGHEDVRLGVFDASFRVGKGKAVELDYEYEGRSELLGCYPYGRDISLYKSSSNIHIDAQRGVDAAWDTRRPRENMRALIREQHASQS